MYYDDFEPDYDSLDYHGMCGYVESLAEEGRTMCGCCNHVYDLDENDEDPGCPQCAKVEAIREGIANGEIDPNAICYACGDAEGLTVFMGKKVCWACYRAIAEGDHKPDTCQFAMPGGRSALRAAGPGNPRVHPCPSCYEPNRLTPQDVARGYQCDTCADRAEGRYCGGDY